MLPWKMMSPRGHSAPAPSQALAHPMPLPSVPSRHPPFRPRRRRRSCTPHRGDCFRLDHTGPPAPLAQTCTVGRRNPNRSAAAPCQLQPCDSPFEASRNCVEIVRFGANACAALKEPCSSCTNKQTTILRAILSSPFGVTSDTNTFYRRKSFPALYRNVRQQMESIIKTSAGRDYRAAQFFSLARCVDRRRHRRSRPLFIDHTNGAPLHAAAQMCALADSLCLTEYPTAVTERHRCRSATAATAVSALSVSAATTSQRRR